MILRILLILLLFPLFEAKVYGLVYSWIRPELGAQMAIEAIILAQIVISFLGFRLLKGQLKRLGGGFFTNVRHQGHALQAAGDTLFYALAGFIFLLPGFGADVLALLLFLRPVRLLIERRLLHRMQAYFTVKMSRNGFSASAGFPGGFPGGGFPSSGPYGEQPRDTEPRQKISSRDDIIDVDVVEH